MRTSMRKVSLMAIILIFICASVVFAADAAQNASTYIIRDVEYTIDGNTRKSVLVHYLEINSGESFATEEALDAYITDKLQLIKNQRTLSEGTITPSLEPADDGSGRIFVDLSVQVSDTWNYIVLPYAKYDSNEGLLLSLRGRNYNFLGGMEELSVDLDYTRTRLEENEYALNSSFAIPFYLWGYEWTFDFSEDLAIIPDEPTNFETDLELSVDLPTDWLTWQASISQEYYLNEDGEEDPDGWYMKTRGRFGSSIPLGFELPGFNEVTYSPALITSIAYKPGDTLSEDRRGYSLGAEHEIASGRIDWMGNFRNGAEISLSQDARWNFSRDRWFSDLDAEFQGHKSFGFMGFSSRFIGFYRYGGEVDDAGDEIRGILDRRIVGDAGFYANFDFPVKMWIWFLDKWFEGHISPFFDYALVSPKGEGLDFSDAWYGVGVEGFAFAKFARSIYLRMSLGLDLEAMLDGASLGENAPRDNEPIYELYIGLGHFYD